MAMAGRKIKLYKGATLVAGGRTDTITINNEPIDVTAKSSDGWRELLTDPATRSVDIASELLFSDAAMVTLAVDDDTTSLQDDFEVRIEGVGGLAGVFHMSGLVFGGAHNGEATQSITLASSGPVTYTAAGP